jgi:hypothetical protein
MKSGCAGLPFTLRLPSPRGRQAPTFPLWRKGLEGPDERACQAIEQVRGIPETWRAISS